MDRRQRKTREAIFASFIDLLAEKSYGEITVSEIIGRADIGRATFYSHFETKDFLLKALCEDLFCHIFDSLKDNESDHRHIFCCDSKEAPFLHLFRHIQKNDNNILRLLSCRNNELFLRYFNSNLQNIVVSQIDMFKERKNDILPESFWINHISSVFTETLRWWIDNGMKESAEEITEYFCLSV